MAEAAEATDRPGVATGLVWTPVGGDIVFIEASKMPGGKTLTLTGQLGDVMKESAQAALSWVRSRAAALGIDPLLLRHARHPPPCARRRGARRTARRRGSRMAMALISLLTDIPVRTDVAMTGEITLRGRVLPVGGIKEKVLAARRAGLTRVILPARNARDLDDLGPDVRDSMEFVLVENMDEADRGGAGPDAHAIEQQPRPAAGPPQRAAAAGGAQAARAPRPARRVRPGRPRADPLPLLAGARRALRRVPRHGARIFSFSLSPE